MRRQTASTVDDLRRHVRKLMRERGSAVIGSPPRWPPYVRSTALTLAIALATALVVAQTFLPNRLSLKAGDVAQQNVTAPRSTRYESVLQTQAARDVAAKQVADQFDASVTTQQRDALDTLARDVAQLRLSNASLGDRSLQLSLLEPKLNDAQRQYLLQTDDATVAAIFKNASDLLLELEGNGIKPDSLLTVQDLAVSRASALHLEKTAAQVVGILTRDYLHVNYLPTETTLKRQRASDAVPPVFVTVAKGQTIIRYGDQVTPFQLEEAQQVGLTAPQADWLRILATFLLVIILFAVALGYMMQFRRATLHSTRQLLLLGSLVLGIVLIAKAIVPLDPRAQYIVPMAAVPMLVSALLDTGLGIIVALAVGLLTGIIADNVTELTLIGFLGGSLGAIVVHRLESLGRWFQAGVLVAGVNFVTLIALGLIERHGTVDELLGQGAFAVMGGLLAAVIAAGLVTFLSEVFGITTPMKLLELMTPNNPLLRRLMVSAPGTYNHSIVAANLAEAAAEAVGANPLLARVGCYFHDIGKVRRPHFFVENQAEMGNIHENLSPMTSSDILNAHVTDGIELLDQYKFPQSVREIVQQHQGTTVKKYFYREALKQGLEVREEDFRYPGPRPRSKEAAIVMMADSIEASTRTLKDRSPEGIRAHVHRIIQGFVRDGQLDDCELSFRDISLMEEAFSNMVVSIYHARIDYPAAATEAQPGAVIAVDTTGGGHDGTLDDAEEKTIPLPTTRTRA
ncbi:MAG: HDIG domain-containing protein [Chloroflexi bacterium]|nr:MAG: HDIG domain-containing protein [Chloroflexota bacterium]